MFAVIAVCVIRGAFLEVLVEIFLIVVVVVVAVVVVVLVVVVIVLIVLAGTAAPQCQFIDAHMFSLNFRSEQPISYSCHDAHSCSPCFHLFPHHPHRRYRRG